MNIRDAFKLLFLAPIGAELVAASCPPFPVYCTTIGLPTCEPEKQSHFYIDGTGTGAGAMGSSSCVFCVLGCSPCINYTIAVIVDCNGRQTMARGTLCCSDPDCCGGQ